jgi:Right handed beta helix region
MNVFGLHPHVISEAAPVAARGGHKCDRPVQQSRILLYSRLLPIFLVTVLTSLTAADVYLSPTGNDAADGSPAHPVASLARAQTLLRQSHSTNAILDQGTYYLPDTLVLTAEDSGTNANPITWQSAPGKTVSISGGLKLDHLNWTPYQNGIVQTSVQDNLQTDQLFINGDRQILARYPNFDPNVNIFNGYAADCISTTRVATWSDPAGGFFHAMHPALWGDFSYLITGKNPDNTLKMEGGWQGNRSAKPNAKYRFVENIFEELDSPGEWFLNKKTHTLYFYPPAGLDLISAVVETPRLKNLIEFRGSEQSPVKWINFKGITFRHTLRTFMETKEPILRSDWTIHRGGAIFFNGCEDCRIDKCFIDQVGGNALFVNNYNRRATIHDCRIDKAGASGVMFCGDPNAVRNPLFEYNQRQSLSQIDRTPGPKTNNYPADCLVDDCLITLPGRFEKQATGVGIDMAARITVRHSSIYDTPRAGINVGDGCWGGDVIEFCDVFDTVKETGDHGSFNSWGRDRWWGLKGVDLNTITRGPDKDIPLLDVVEPITLRNSRWRCDHGWDIDLDDGSSNYRIYNNLCLNGGIKNREGFDRTVENNICVGNSFHSHVRYQNSEDIFRHNIVFHPYKPVQMPAVWGKEIDFNLLDDAQAKAASPAAELQRLSKQDQHSIKADAMFTDPSHGDYTVKDGSPALTPGFKNFPMDQFGVQSPELKAIARTPSFTTTAEIASNRSGKVQEWMGAKVRNIIGEGEMSAHGLPGETGVLIVDLPTDSPLAKAGVKKDDVILGANEKKVDTVKDLPAKDVTTLSVSRDQNLITLHP